MTFRIGETIGGMVVIHKGRAVGFSTGELLRDLQREDVLRGLADRSNRYLSTWQPSRELFALAITRRL